MALDVMVAAAVQLDVISPGSPRAGVGAQRPSVNANDYRHVKGARFHMLMDRDHASWSEGFKL